MKSCKDTADHADELVGSFSSERLGEIYNQVTALRNADEEIVKSEERNRMQMEDLSEELGTQQKNQKELLQMVDPLFRHVIERKE
jgi:regulator of replication initiation timing